MVMVYREDTPLPNAPLPQIIPWELLRGIGIVELYSTERFIEPPTIRKMPMSLLFHQTLSTIVSCGELTPKELADRVLSMPAFVSVSRETYRELIVSMVNDEYLEMTEMRGLIIGLRGERIINSFKFYAVFKDSEDYTVRCDSEEIGTITTPPPVGERFALAGRVWEVKEIDLPRRLLFVKLVEGKMEVSWPGDGGEIHTKLLVAMRDVLFNKKDYPFLGDNARARLENARRVAKNAGMDKNLLVFLGGQSYVLFPWLGTRPFRTLRRYLKLKAHDLGISDIQSEGCSYITFKASKDSGDNFIGNLRQMLMNEGIDTKELVGESECPVMDKYDDYIPPHLLREAYATDRLSASEVLERFIYGV